MIDPIGAGVRRAGRLRSGALGVLGAAALAPVLVAGCSGSTGPARSSPDVAQVIASLGAVPVPTAVPAESTPSARPGHPAVLAIGGPVRMRFADGGAALVTALGPSQTVSGRAVRTRAVLTLRVRMSRGTESIAASELSSRDETGRIIALRPEGARRVDVGAGAEKAVRVAGTYDNGSAQVTWRHDGHVMAVWTFTIELD